MQSCHLVVDGSGWSEDLVGSLLPLRPALLAAERWPPLDAASGALARLAWLEQGFAERPLIGVTRAPLLDERGSPLRGLARLGAGVALISRAALRPREVQSLLRHELAHALGLDHCPAWSCALNARPWPLDLADRGPRLCAGCEARLQQHVAVSP